jgi:hypothetical protein
LAAKEQKEAEEEASEFHPEERNWPKIEPSPYQKQRV